MIKEDSLSTLIQSLSMNEKRYFKLFSEKHIIGEQNKYSLLFDFLVKNPESTENDIKSFFKEHQYAFEHVSSDKNYLFNLVVRSLTEFHFRRTFNLEIKKLLEVIEILFHKGLYHLCLKSIHKAEKIALACENFSLVLDILNWKKKCMGYSSGINQAKLINEEMDIYLEKLTNLKQITNLYYESYLLRLKFDKHPDESIIEFESLLLSPLLQSEENALSLQAKIFYFLTYSHYYFVKNENKEEFENLQKTINLIHSSEVYTYENPLDYISIYNRLLSLKKYYQKEFFYDDIIKLRNFAQSVEFPKEIVAQRVFIYTYTAELQFLLLENRFSDAQVCIQNIEKEIIKLSVVIEPMYLIQFFYLYSIGLNAVKDNRKALGYINKILNEFPREANPLYFVKTELMNILIHFELENFELVPALAKGFKRKYKQDIHLSSLEFKLISFVSNASNNPVQKNKHRLELKNMLEYPDFQIPKPDFFMDFYCKWIKKTLSFL